MLHAISTEYWKGLFFFNWERYTFEFDRMQLYAQNEYTFLEAMNPTALPCLMFYNIVQAHSQTNYCQGSFTSLA